MPAPQRDSVRRFRRQARALGWHGRTVSVMATSCVPGPHRSVAAGAHPRGDIAVSGRRLARRSTGRSSAERQHAAVAAPYAHVTAPLRRLVDRFGLVVCGRLRANRCRLGCGVAGATARADGRRRPARLGRRAGVHGCSGGCSARVSGREQRAGERRRPQRSWGSGGADVLDPAVVASAQGSAALGATVTVAVVGADDVAGRVELEISRRPRNRLGRRLRGSRDRMRRDPDPPAF